jgi:FeS assembly protein IscX
MGLRWSDSIDIAIELIEAHSEVDPQWVRFTDLHAWVCALADFEDDPEKSSEGLLEAIQMAWIDEVR